MRRGSALCDCFGDLVVETSASRAGWGRGWWFKSLLSCAGGLEIDDAFVVALPDAWLCGGLH